MPGHCLVHVRLMHCMRVWLRNGYTQAYVQVMQHTHSHKAVAGRAEAKKLLSRRRQSNYNNIFLWPESEYITKKKVISKISVDPILCL